MECSDAADPRDKPEDDGRGCRGRTRRLPTGGPARQAVRADRWADPSGRPGWQVGRPFRPSGLTGGPTIHAVILALVARICRGCLGESVECSDAADPRDKPEDDEGGTCSCRPFAEAAWRETRRRSIEEGTFSSRQARLDCAECHRIRPFRRQNSNRSCASMRRPASTACSRTRRSTAWRRRWRGAAPRKNGRAAAGRGGRRRAAPARPGRRRPAAAAPAPGPAPRPAAEQIAVPDENAVLDARAAAAEAASLEALKAALEAFTGCNLRYSARNVGLRRRQSARPTSCSSARRRGARRTSRACPSSAAPASCSTACWRRSGSTGRAPTSPT